MKRCEDKSASKERQSCWYARKQGRPLSLTEHGYQRKAKEDVSGRKHQILPTTIADLRKQMLDRVHLLPSIDCSGSSIPASWLNRIACWVFAGGK
jgi:hypothetical protein